jgi:predicted HTH domain antitoxin
MKKEQMVGARLPSDLVRELELIQNVEQSDRSTTVRRLLSRAVRDWKLEHAAREYGERRVSLARAALDAGVSLWEMMDYARSGRVAAQYDLDDLERDFETVSGEAP